MKCLSILQEPERATLTCKFTGTGFELFGAKSDQVGKFQYQIDNGAWKEVDTRSNTFARQRLLKVNGLEKREHTLTIKGIKNNKVSFLMVLLPQWISQNRSIQK